MCASALRAPPCSMDQLRASALSTSSALRAKNCSTGDILADEQAQAARKEEVLGALSQIAIRFRTRVGESLATIEKHSMPLEEATTSSLEAWKAFSTASRVYYSGDAAAALPLFKRAVAIDPDFAIAHARLGIHYSNVGEWTLARESTLKAYRLRDRASDVERFWIDTFYDRQVTGNLERQQQTMESWARTYPRDPVPLGLLAGLATISTGRYELSIAAADKALALDPDRGRRISQQGTQPALPESPGRCRSHHPSSDGAQLRVPSFLLVRYFIAFLNGDGEDMKRKAALAREKLATEDMISHVEALVLARSGRLQEARRTSAVAVDIAQKAGQRERAALFDAATAVWEAFYGQCGRSQTEGRRRRSISPGAATWTMRRRSRWPSQAMWRDRGRLPTISRRTFPRIRRCNTCICRRCGPCSR